MYRPSIPYPTVHRECDKVFGLPTSAYYLNLTHTLLQLEKMPLDILMNEIDNTQTTKSNEA
jgi:hypothetical protein